MRRTLVGIEGSHRDLKRWFRDESYNYSVGLAIPGRRASRVGVGTSNPSAQLAVVASANGSPAIYTQAADAPSGSGQSGSDGIDAFGSATDPNSTGFPVEGGSGISAFGGGSPGQGGAGGTFTGASSNRLPGDGVVAFAGGPTTDFGPFAGSFDGDIFVNGGVSNQGSILQIDHPLDPLNKVLMQAAVESPDLMNIYNGNVTTDSNGQGVVELPEYFESLNRDFRYQLTVIGQFAQAIVAEKIGNNRFTIRTDKPNVEVSWQVTGIRQDAWANAHRVTVEQLKPGREAGHYLHPELFGAPEESSIMWARHPEIMKKIREVRQKQSHPVQATNVAR